MWIFGRKGPSGFSANSTAEDVTHGIDATGLTAIVTDGRVLALRGVHVVMAVRNVEAGKTVRESICKENPNAKIDVMELDLSWMASVRNFASQYSSSGMPLNILINNAGVMATPFMLSQENIEVQFATNHIGHFILTQLLLDTLKSTSKESKKEGRIVNLSSEGHRLTYSEGIRFDKINDKASYSSWQAYGQSKLANILHAKHLAKNLKEEGCEITVNALHPGAISTNLLHHQNFVFNGLANIFGKIILKNIPQGAATTCYVALSPQLKEVTGEYFMDSNKAEPSVKAKSRIWQTNCGNTV